jgi:hypothetical protein
MAQTAMVVVILPHLGDGRDDVSTGRASSTAAPHTILSRFIATTTTGAVQPWQWTHGEALAHVEAALFVRPCPRRTRSRGPWWRDFAHKLVSRSGMPRSVVTPNNPAVTHCLFVRGQYFPRYVINIAKHFAGAYTVPSSSLSDPLARDAFGSWSRRARTANFLRPTRARGRALVLRSWAVGVVL